MTLEELIATIDADPELPDALVTVGHGEELKVVLRKHLEPVLAERGRYDK